MTVIPITLPVANVYIERWHRHHAPLVTVTAGGTVRLNGGFAWVSLAAITDEAVVGVAVLGRPSNRNSDDGQTVEVLRLATDGTPNACSTLLGAAARSARAFGAAKVITYTLASESGTSLRGAGWTREADGIVTCWTRGKGKAKKGGSGNTIWRPHFDEDKVRWSVVFREPIAVDGALISSLVPEVEPQPSLFGGDQ